MSLKALLTTTFLFVTTTLLCQNIVIDSVAYAHGYRKIRLFLTEQHRERTDRLTLVMLDAQNLFDEKTSYAGEWQVDEYLRSLPNEQQAVVIGIDHGNALRMNELTPFKNEKYGGGDAAAFLQWFVITALPAIASKHHIKLSPNRTAIAGSSFGGLFAHYAATSHPDIFNAAGVFSPSYWFSDAIYDFAANRPSDGNQFYYLTAGTDEGEEMIPDMQRMYMLLKEKHPDDAIYKAVINGAQHNEAQWRASFPAFYTQWLLFTSRY